MMGKIFGAIYVTYESGELRKSEFSIILLFFFPYEHLFNCKNTAISNQILSGSEISINILIMIVML